MPNKPQLFWDFSMQLYKQEGVADACLSLQDKFNIDVNLILFCYWYGYSFGEIERPLLQQIIKFSTKWRDSVVQPLRNVRVWMKQNTDRTAQFDHLRQKIKVNELAAEKYQQELIESLVASVPHAKKTRQTDLCIRANLEILLEETSIEINEIFAAKLEKISKALEKNTPSPA